MSIAVPLLLALAGAGIGAATNHKHPFKGAMIGAGTGALGGAGLGALGIGAGAAGAAGAADAAAAGTTAGAGASAAGAAAQTAGWGAKAAQGLKYAQIFGSGLKALSQGQPQQLPQMYQGGAPQGYNLQQMQQPYARPFAPQVQMNGYMTNPGGYQG